MSDADAIELILLSIRTIKDAEHALTFKVQRDDVNRINFAAKIGHQFAATELYPQPAQEEMSGDSYNGTKPPAAPNRSPGALTRYAQQAVIRCNEMEFQLFLALDFGDRSGAWANARQAILELMEVESRKEIIEGTPAGDRWERLMIRFEKWKRDRNSASAPGA